MHAQGIVHGNLDPSHIMWFATDFSWKLVNLDAASAVGDPVLLDHITSRRYAAPEIRRAMSSVRNRHASNARQTCGPWVSLLSRSSQGRYLSIVASTE